MVNYFRFKPKHEHVHRPSSVEFWLAVLIAALLMISLISQQFVHLPRYVIPALILLFILFKIRHILKKGGTILEDYTAIGAIALFFILYLILGEKVNAVLSTIFIFILLYSAGLMLWIKTTFGSRKVTHFLISYATTVIMVILLFAGAYTSGAGSFIEFGEEKNLSFSESLYFSTVTFTTVGFGDIVPLGINRLFAGLESILGVIINVALIGYLLASGRYDGY